MAALLFHLQPRFFSIPVPQPKSFSAFRTLRRFSASAVAMTVECSAGKSPGTAILWYKHDLRVEDHPGLVAASSHRCVVPLYVFDRRILSRFSDEMLEILLFALEDLRKLLKEQGSNLMIRFGTAERVIGELAKQVQANSIIVEEEVEYDLHVMVETVKESLSVVSFAGEDPKVLMWSTPFYDIKNLNDLPDSFDDFKKMKLPVLSPLLTPNLPENAMNLSWGDLPTLTNLKEFMDDISDTGKNRTEWKFVKKLPAESVLHSKKLRGNLEMRPSEIGEKNLPDSNAKTDRRKKPKESAFVTHQGSAVGGGAGTVLNALAAYLRYLEGTARDEWQEVHDKLRLAEKREGASFPALFGSALLLGIISRRRVCFEAIKYERERNGGFLSPFGYSTSTVAAAISTVSSMEYTVAGQEGPPILLVHGFGAFLEHYRDNIYPIADAGNRVWAITLLGFGKSEKPNIIYTELLWAEMVRDFIIDVVGEPVHLVGNSIGGYAVAIVSGLWSSLVKSVVLMNSAGKIIPGYSAFGKSGDRQISGAAWLGARLLLPYLRFNIRNILKSFYPTKTNRVDDQLIDEMLRASYDPGVTFVLESIFSFDLSLPLNYLLEEFGRKILVVQGMKDPLTDSKSMLAMFREHCPGIAIKDVDAGHCPHDELPDEVNSIIKDWVMRVEKEPSLAASKEL